MESIQTKESIKVRCVFAYPIEHISIFEDKYEEKEFSSVQELKDYIIRTTDNFLSVEHKFYNLDFDYSTMKCEEIYDQFCVTAVANKRERYAIAILSKMIEI